MITQAKQLIDNGRPEDAIDMLEEHLEGAPDDHVARNLLAFAHYQGGDFAAAESVYRTMVARPDPDPRNQYSLGRALEAQGKVGEARAWIDAAAAAGLERAIADRDRLAKSAVAQPAAGSAAAPASTPVKHVPLTELGIPQTEQELTEYTHLLRERAKQDWWTQNWYSIPWGVRLAQVVALVAILAFMGWVFANLAAA